MAGIVVGFASQKGGVMKSTLARMIATVAARDEIFVRIADLDFKQKTCADWMARRLAAGHEPAFEVTPYKTAGDAVASAERAGVQLLVIDSPGKADDTSEDVARHCNLVLQPTGPSMDDLQPAVMLFHALVKRGIPASKLAFVLTGIATASEEQAARNYLKQAGYEVLENTVPHRPLLREAQNRGKAISEIGPPSLRMKMTRLAEEIASKIESA